MSRMVFSPEEVIVVSNGKEDIGKLVALGNDGHFDSSVIPGIDDLQTQITTEVAARKEADEQLQSDLANYLPLAGGTMTGAINEAMGASIASAATTDIGAATGNFVQVTGTTAITSLGTVQAGTRRIVEFTGALTLTHNDASLILPGAADITTAAGDVAGFVSLGSGNWKCTGYLRADGTAVVSAERQQVAIRQTVLAGPVDSNGYAANLSAVSGSLAISELAGTVTTWANGYDNYGALDYVQQITADVASAWSNLTASSTLYLYKDYNASTGNVIYGFTTLAPVYQDYAPSSASTGQYWFDTVNYAGYYYDGSAWVSVVRVFVGECVTGTSSVSSVTCYAYRGRYDSGWFAVSSSTYYTKAHNLGVDISVYDVKLLAKNSTNNIIGVPADVYYDSGAHGGVAIAYIDQNNAKVGGYGWGICSSGEYTADYARVFVARRF